MLELCAGAMLAGHQQPLLPVAMARSMPLLLLQHQLLLRQPLLVRRLLLPHQLPRQHQHQHLLLSLHLHRLPHHGQHRLLSHQLHRKLPTLLMHSLM